MTELHVVKETRSLKEWGRLIDCAVKETAEAIVNTGRLLVEARDEHPGSFRDWVNAGGCCLSWMHAHRFMRVAESGVSTVILRNADKLPAAITTLLELSHLDAYELDRLISEGVITSSMTKRAAQALVETEQAPAWTNDHLAQAMQFVKEGATQKEASSRFGVPKSTLSEHLRSDGLSLKARQAEQRKLTRLVREMMNTVDALVSSLQILDTRPQELDSVTWPWLDQLSESLHTLTRFTKELTRARNQQQIISSTSGAQGASALGADLDDASQPGGSAQL